MAKPGREEQEIRGSFIRRAFSRYYEKEDVHPPSKIENREFGVITERGGMWRHLGFRDAGDLRGFIGKQLPLHAYHSSAYYETPSARTMGEKVWQGADLVFDLDADHIDGAEKMSQGEMFDAVKVEFKKLLDSYLLGDFGFDEEDIQIVFSGGRGYHAHVRDERVLKLDSHMRRDLVDYITLPDKDLSGFIVKKTFDVKTFRQHSNAKHIYLLPDEGVAGWKGKFRQGVLEYLDTSETKEKKEIINELRNYDGIGSKMSNEIWRELFDGDEGNRGMDIIKRTNSLEAFSSDRNRNQFVRFILNNLRVLAGETDEPVTSDIKRLIRLPGSLHGKTGFVVRLLDRESLDDFEPLRDAVWEGFTDTPVKVTGKENFEIDLKGESFTIKKGAETELPEFAALFLLCQKRCEITIR
jgi:DNA primase small subunit